MRPAVSAGTGKDRSRLAYLVNFIHPRVELIVAAAGDVGSLVLGDNLKTVGFQLRSIDCRDLPQENKRKGMICILRGRNVSWYCAIDGALLHCGGR